jgi:hypothetical protein
MQQQQMPQQPQQQPQQGFFMPQPFVPSQPHSGQYNSIPPGYQPAQQQPAAMPQVRCVFGSCTLRFACTCLKQLPASLIKLPPAKLLC